MARLSAIQMAQRRQKIVDLDASGHTQPEIAKLLKVNQSTVSRELQAARDFAFSHATLVPSNKIVMIRELHYIIQESRAAWEASKDHSRREGLTTRKDAGGDTTSTSEHVEETWREGNPAFLNTSLAAIRELQELLGFKRTGDTNVLYQAQVIWTTEQSEELRLQAGADFDYKNYFDYLDQLAKLGIIQGPGEIVIDGEVVDGD